MVKRARAQADGYGAQGVGLGWGALNPDLNPLPNSGRTSLPALLFTGCAAVDPTQLPISQRAAVRTRENSR